ncbi:MAG: hypothetical protein AMXMBFR33_31100 [Candidatus Xenobia bacterium]
MRVAALLVCSISVLWAAGCAGRAPGDTAPLPGTTLTGLVVVDGPVAGAEVSLLRLRPQGTIGEDRQSPTSFPVPPPIPVGVTTTDAMGRFELPVEPGTYLVQSSGGTFREGTTGSIVTIPRPAAWAAAVTVQGSQKLTLSPYSTMAARRAHSLVRSGLPPEPAVARANRELADYFGLASLTDEEPDSPGYAALLASLSEYARKHELRLVSLGAAGARDASDGRFDGREGEVPLTVLPLGDGKPVDLPADAFRSGGAVSARNTSTGVIAEAPPAYVSPYSLNFTTPIEDLTFDFGQPPRNSVPAEGHPPEFDDWYVPSAYPASELPWGPLPALYPEPVVPDGYDPVVWKRERVLAVAQQRIGTNYQHHHIPDWNPPTDWPDWIAVSLGTNSPGIDCSDFSSWNYNYGLGMRLCTAVGEQAANTELPGDCGGAGPAVSVSVLLQAQDSSPQDYQTIVSTLQTGDLLYIRGDASGPPGTGITHVIMWVGSVGQGGDDPLIIDSHDNHPPVKDVNGQVIPAGVHLRPFVEGSWYHQGFDHALRIVQ